MAKRTLDDTHLPNGSSKLSTNKRIRKQKYVTEFAVSNGPSTAMKGERKTETKEERKERKEQKRLMKIATLEANSNGHNGKNFEALQPAHPADKVASRTNGQALMATKQKQQQSPDKGLAGPMEHQESSNAGSSSNIYIENPQLASLSQTQVDEFMAENFISISDPKSTTKSLRPIIEFAYLPMLDLAHEAAFRNFKAPTPIQAAAWPFLFAARDVIGIAETGSGKTMAFALPCIRYIASLPNKFKGAKAIVISPTRELAMQSYEQVTILASVVGMKAVCVYGGVPKDEQRKALKNADIVVATPGRLNDLINEGSANLGAVGYVVLDEADRMLDKGFEEEIRKIVKTTMPLGQRQTLMFTATWPESVRSLAATFMTSPVMITIGDNPSGGLRANARIAQKVEVVDPRNKEYRLLQLLKQYQSGSQKDDRILVFCLYKKEATRVEGFIRSKGIRVAGIHGDLSQEQRTKSLDAFKKGVTPVLVATDVAARGLDIPAVKLVINCTFPLTVEDYVHRIGRTGRAGKEGLAITLFTEHDKAQSGA